MSLIDYQIASESYERDRIESDLERIADKSQDAVAIARELLCRVLRWPASVEPVPGGLALGYQIDEDREAWVVVVAQDVGDVEITTKPWWREEAGK